MADSKKKVSKPKTLQPALSDDAREKQLVSAALDLAEKRILDGTASSQVLTHFLKLGTAQARLDLEIKEEQKAMTKAKTEALLSEQRTEAMYEEALKAMRSYQGQDVDESEEEDYYE